MDVTSLYTHILHSDGLKALKHFLNKCATKEPSTDTLIHLAELVLNKNTFSFSKQVNGIAMGTKMDPRYHKPSTKFEYPISPVAQTLRPVYRVGQILKRRLIK